jgi:predicted enzyme related to lactoylglutathione lyase
MEMKLELVPLPVTDLDRAKAFYLQCGFVEDVDMQIGADVRFVQLTPPGSGCSVSFSTGLPEYDGVPGSLRGLHLVVPDIAAARAELVSRGIAVSEVVEVADGVKYAPFADPDGNTLTLQEMSWRTGDQF